MIASSTLNFLKGLAKHNDKEWFEKNRKAYEEARADFAQQVQRIIDAHSKKDESIRGLVAKDCLFRINRDVRFSKDKSPYKINFGASISKGGKKGVNAVYYLHLQPGNNSFAGGGIWMPEAELIKKIRQEIDYNADEFSRIVSSKQFKQSFADLDIGEETSLLREPKGYEKDNPMIKYIKLKSWVASAPLSDEELTSPVGEKKIITAFASIQSLNEFINKAIGE